MDNKGSDDGGSKVTEDQVSNDGEIPHVPKMPNRKYGFFRDDQITFLVSHPEDAMNAKQLEAFRVAINFYLQTQKLGMIKPGAISVISFPSFTDDEQKQTQHLLAKYPRATVTRAFSLITTVLTGAPENPLEFLRAVKSLRADLIGGSQDNPKDSTEGNSSKPEQEEDFTDKILKDIKKGVDLSNIIPDKISSDIEEGVDLSGIIIEGASLNWLTSVVSQGAGTGGPGGVPSPYYGSRKNAPHTFDIVQTLKAHGIYGAGKNVRIAILDTAPSAQDLVAAYKEWPDHPLIKDLLGPNGKLVLHPASYEETVRLGNTSNNESDYKMTDHGLFIAGIIHSIVPNAEIHLFEVLNQYGVGDFRSLTEGLKRATRLCEPGVTVLVNCSWMLDFPSDENHCHPHSKDRNEIQTDPDLEFEQEVLDFIQSDQTLLRSMKSLFVKFSSHGRGAIAAAGNDAYDDENESTPAYKHIRPKARFPAALIEVTGVGALPVTLDHDNQKIYRTSAFSNRADRPEKEGIATLGGEEGDGKGILGLYIGEFPDGRLNTTKWAWWAGTSFATPILTGVLASLASGPSRSQTPAAAIAELRGKHFLDGSTGQNESVLATTQC